MDWEILEIKEKITIKEQVKSLYQAINHFQTEIIADIKPKLVSSELLLDNSNWWYVEKEGLHAYTFKNTLFFANSDERSNYSSFMETNVAFSKQPTYPIQVLPEEKLAFCFQCEQSQGISVKLAIAEYNDHGKEKTTMLSLEKENYLTLGKNTKKLRLALKITGKGILQIKKIAIERIFEKALKKETKQLTNGFDLSQVNKFSELKVACIFDEFTMTSYQKEVELITFTPENWKEVLSKTRPHFLFVESAWHGNFGAWQYKVGEYSNTGREELINLLKWCNENQIPTIFWNKEDPIHFDKFIDSAKRFDYIYTSDANKIPDYKKKAKHENVYALPFAAEPSQHNPIQLLEARENKICFAGSYYSNRHPERREIMDEMLEISQEFGLVIYDRNYHRSELEFRFPKQFEKNVVGSLAYSDIDKAYKGYRFMLNVNSVIHSPTMFSRRVFEGLASGTPILSSYSEGIEEIFGQTVMISKNPDELRKQMTAISTDDNLYRKKSLEGIREVYEKHTYQHRLSFLLGNIGINLPVVSKTVTMIQIVASEEELKNSIQLFMKQSYENKKLAVFIKNIEFFSDINMILNQYQTEMVSIYLLDYMENYPDFSSLLESDFMAFIQPSHFYGRNYLKDLMIASIYTDADFIGKASYWEKREEKMCKSIKWDEYTFVNELYPSRSIIRTRYPFRDQIKSILENWNEDQSLAPYMKQGAKMFSSDAFNFIENSAEAPKEWRNKVEI